MRRALKKINGKGKLFQNDEEIAIVSYSIQRWQDVTIVANLSDTPSGENVEDGAQGTIQVISGNKFLAIGESCVLVQGDGRQYHVFLSTRDMGSGQYDLRFEQLSELE